MGFHRRIAYCLMSGLAVLSAGISPIPAQLTQSNGAQSAKQTYPQPLISEQHLQYVQSAYLSGGPPQTVLQNPGTPVSIRERAATLLQAQRGRSVGYDRLPKDNPLASRRTNHLYGKRQVSILSSSAELTRSNSAQQESGIQPFAEPPIKSKPQKIQPPSNPIVNQVEQPELGTIPFPPETPEQEPATIDPGSGTDVPKPNQDSQPPVPEPVADNQGDSAQPTTEEVPQPVPDPSVQVDDPSPVVQPQQDAPYPSPQQMISPEMAPPPVTPLIQSPMGQPCCQPCCQPYCQPDRQQYCQPYCQPAYQSMPKVPAPPGYDQLLAPTLAAPTLARPTFADGPPDFSGGVVAPERNVYSNVVSDCSTCQTSCPSSCQSSCRSSCQSCDPRGRILYFGSFVGYTGLSDLEGQSNGGQLLANSGAGMGIALGRRHGPRLRSELEFAYRHNDISGFELRGSQTALDGELDSYSGMVNAYLDFIDFRTTHFKPYVGAGIGFTSIDTTIRTLSGKNLVDPGTDDSSFAYQFIAGVNFKNYGNKNLFIEYRFFDATAFDIESNMRDASDRYSFDTNNVFVGFRCCF